MLIAIILNFQGIGMLKTIINPIRTIALLIYRTFATVRNYFDLNIVTSMRTVLGISYTIVYVDDRARHVAHQTDIIHD